MGYPSAEPGYAVDANGSQSPEPAVRFGPLSPLSLVQPHATRVVADRCRPVREQPDELHILCEHVERLVHVAVFLDRGAGRIEIVVGTHTGCAPAQVDALEAPADDIEAQRPEILREHGR